MSSGELDESLLVAAADHAHVVREPAVHPPGGNRVLVIVILLHTSDDTFGIFRDVLLAPCTSIPISVMISAITRYIAPHLAKLSTRSSGGLTSTRPLLPSRWRLGARVRPSNTTSWYRFSITQNLRRTAAGSRC